MSEKVEAQEFIKNLLSDAGLRNIRTKEDHITCECPFHNNTNHKTFRVSTVESVSGKFSDYLYPFHCFSCHEGGDIYKLIAHLTGASYRRAIKLFKKRVSLSPVSISKLNAIFSELSLMSREIGEVKEIILPPSSKVNKPMIEYLQKRCKRYHGVLDIDMIIRRYELYYCSRGDYAGRIIMPIRNELNNVVGFNNRSVVSAAKLKALYLKGDNIHRFFHGINHAIGKRKVIIVEGSFDLFQVISALLQHKEFKDYAVVCNMGTTVTDERIAILQKMFDEIYIMTDHDSAGIKCARDYYFKLKDVMPVFDCSRSYPKGKDPGKCTAVEIYEAIKNPLEIKIYNEFQNMWKWFDDKYN